MPETATWTRFMRFNKASFATISGTAIALIAATCLCTTAQADSISKVDFKNAKSTSQVEGKQIAVSIPGLGEAKIIVTPKSAVKSKSTGKPKSGRQAIAEPLINAGLAPGQNISVKVPRTVDEFVDDMDQVRQKVSRSAASVWGEVSRLLQWIGRSLKQYFAPPTITPGGYPYIEQPGQVAAGARLHFTREGRLKTVVSR